jgi:hypothetical protein
MLLRKALILLTVLTIGLSGFISMAHTLSDHCASCLVVCDDGCGGMQETSKICHACLSVVQPDLARAAQIGRAKQLFTAEYASDPELQFTSLNSPPRLAPPRA